MLLRYDIELYKIDVTGYEDVGSMPREVFVERKNNASFIDGDNYLLLNLLCLYIIKALLSVINFIPYSVSG